MSHPLPMTASKQSFSDLMTVSPRPPRDDIGKLLWFALKHRLNLAEELCSSTPADSATPRPAPFQRPTPGQRPIPGQKFSAPRMQRGPILLDALLGLLNSLETSGKEEVFRLLLESRYLVPFIVPENDNYRTEAASLKYVENLITSNGDMANLVTDTSIKRIAVISERPVSASATTDWIKNIFHVRSLHCLDFTKTKNMTKLPCVAELGWGFLEKNTKHTPVMVLHVIGDYKQIDPFVQKFADALVVDIGESESNATLSEGYVLKWRYLDDVAQYDVNDNVGVFDLTIKCRTVDAYEIITDYLLECPLAPIRACIGSINVSGVINTPDCSLANAELNRHKIDFSKLRTEVLQLQRIYVEEARKEIERQQSTDVELCKHLTEEIQELQLLKRDFAPHNKNVPLIAYFIEILQLSSAAERELAILDLKHYLALACHEISEKARNEYRQARDAFNRLKNKKTQKAYAAALDNWDMTITGTEHLWRELSHMFVSDTATYAVYPNLAAQHLLDGFPIELMDGDAAMVNMIWIKAILNHLSDKLPNSRVFVLSIMGVQSSGKSTLLNYMFGVQLRTSVSRTTRGVNMQLLKCDGRTEYDYILLLDTEGIRSPEHLGMEDSVWRDNRMATLAILPADATIILTKGESTVTISEILPIVLSVFLDSVLAGNVTGQIASKFYFVFNQIDLSQATNMETIVHTLLENLRVNAKKIEAIRADKIPSKNEPEPAPEVELSTKYFHNFHVDINDEKASDVRFLGTIKGSSEPPNDIPDSNYGKRLLDIWDYIHSSTTDNSANTWNARSIEQFLKYLELVWDCINKSDFQLNFIAAHERLMYEMLMKILTKFKQELAKVYSEKFDQVLQAICQDESSKISLAQNSKMYELKLKLLVQEPVDGLKKQVLAFLDDQRFATWRQDQVIKWENHLTSIETHFCRLVQDKVHQVFHYEAKVDQYKLELQDRLTKLFSEGNQNVDLLFPELFNEFVRKITKDHPPLAMEVPKLFDKAFFDKDITTPAEAQMIRNGRPKYKEPTFFNSLFSNFNASKKMTPEEVKCLVANYVLAHLKDVKCYTNDVVMNCCLKTKSMLKQEHVPNALMEIAIYTLYETLRIELIYIQEEWDRDNSIVAKFKKYEGTMKKLANDLSNGYKAADLLISSLDEWLANNLSDAIAEQIKSDVAAFLQSQRWVANPVAMQALIDKDLLDAVKRKQIDQVLDNIKYPVDHTSKILHGIIRSKIHEVSASTTDTVAKSVELALIAAANSASSAADHRSEVFVTTLKRELQKTLKKSGTSAMVRNMPLAKNDTMNCDHQGPTIFTTNEDLNVKNALLAKLNTHKANLAPYHFALTIDPEEILKIMRDECFGADDGIKPRCGSPCPRCKCPCTKVHGHESMTDENEKRHDTYHQPLGIVGGQWVGSNELCEMSCPTCVVNDCSMVFTEGNRPYKEFDQVYTTWTLPTIQRPLPLREYIFARFQDQLAAKYNHTKSSKMPPEFLSHDLEAIERDIMNILK